MEEGDAQAVGRPGPVGGHPHRGGARAGPDAVRAGRLLGPRGHLRDPWSGRRPDGAAQHAGDAGRGRRHPARHRGVVRAGDRPAQGRRRRRRARPGERAGPGRAAGGRALRGAQRRGAAVHAQALRAVHDQHAAAGGRRASCASPDAARHADRAAAVRERLHHLHAHRQLATCRRRPSMPRARAQARQLYGPEYVPDAPRRYAGKVKNAQEAHEAIRPSGDVFRTPGELARELSGDELRLYELDLAAHRCEPDGRCARGFRDRTARGTYLTRPRPPPADTGQTATDAEFSASGKVITFPGFLRAYVEGSDDPDAELETTERRLPRVAVRAIRWRSTAWTAQGHTTSPPARFTEASPRQAARGARASAGRQHLREHHHHDPGPRLRLEEGLAHWCRPGWLSPSSACWNSISAGSSTTASPPRWRTTSTSVARAVWATGRASGWTPVLLRQRHSARTAGSRSQGGLKKLIGKPTSTRSTPATSTRS